jgi:hypothetical protein
VVVHAPTTRMPVTKFLADGRGGLNGEKASKAEILTQRRKRRRKRDAAL